MKFSISNVLGYSLAAIAGAFWQLAALSAILQFGVAFVLLVVAIALARVFMGTTNPMGMSLYAMTLPIMVGSWLAAITYWCAVTEVMLCKAANRPVRVGAVLRNAFFRPFPAPATA